MKNLCAGIVIIALLTGCCPKQPSPIKLKPALAPAIVSKMMNGDKIVDCKSKINPQPDFRKNP